MRENKENEKQSKKEGKVPSSASLHPLNFLFNISSLNICSSTKNAAKAISFVFVFVVTIVHLQQKIFWEASTFLKQLSFNI